MLVGFLLLMKRNIFSFLASLNVGFIALSFFFLGFPSLQFTPTTKAESVITEYGSNFPWKIEEGETMATIAEKWYGDTSFVTTIWNDNPWIEDPSSLEEGWVLEMRHEKPILPSKLTPELAEKQKKLQDRYVKAAIIQVATPQKASAVLSTSAGGPLNEAQIQYLGQCESGMTATRNSGNGYYGAFQFSPGTWRSMNTGYERADMAPIEVQKEAVQRLLSRSSIYNQFPGCARKMQAMGMI